MTDAAAMPQAQDTEALSPREAQLDRVARVLLTGAAIHAVLAVLFALAGSIGAAAGSTEVFSVMRGVALFGWVGDLALVPIVLIMISLGSGSLLLLALVGALAHEFWTLLLSAAGIIASIALLILWGSTPALITLGVLGVVLFMLTRNGGMLRANPVALKELRERMRGGRAFAVITVYLALMSAVAVLLFLLNTPTTAGFTTSVTGTLGRNLFAGIVGLELMLIIFIAPAFTSGAVTGERERKTFDLLQITLLPRPSFIVGKLESALGYIFLLLLAAIPLQSIAFLFGGVTETELFLSFVILMVTAIMMSTVGIFFSTLVDKTMTASMRAYALAVAMIIGVPLIGGGLITFFTNAASGQGTGFVGSPVVEAALIYIGAFLTSLNPFTTATTAQQLLLSPQGSAGFIDVTLSTTGQTIPVASPWISFTIIYLLIALVLLAVAVRRIRTHEEF